MLLDNAVFPHDHGVDNTPVDDVSVKGITGRYMRPMVMQFSLLIHAVLEALALGLTVRFCDTHRRWCWMCVHVAMF